MNDGRRRDSVPTGVRVLVPHAGVNALAVADAVLEAQVRQVTDQVALRELLEAAALINLSKRPAVRIGTATRAVYSGSVASVMECIKAHESGNYSESSHPGSGSGAYQYTPPTFTTWFARWASATGYTGPSYAYAYQAPAAVQDGVTEYALTHGGAGNWSMRWGNDPCTAGLPGGG